MAWKYRYLELPVLLVCGVAIAHCSAKPEAAPCANPMEGENGVVVCGPDEPTGTPTNSGPGGMTSTTIPSLDTTGTSSTTGIPVLDTSGSPSSAGPVTSGSAGPTATVTGGPGP